MSNEKTTNEGFWIPFYDGFLNVLILIGCIAATVAFFIGFYHTSRPEEMILAALSYVGIILALLLSLALLKIFVGIARDIKAIRNKVETLKAE